MVTKETKKVAHFPVRECCVIGGKHGRAADSHQNGKHLCERRSCGSFLQRGNISLQGNELSRSAEKSVWRSRYRHYLRIC